MSEEKLIKEKVELFEKFREQVYPKVYKMIEEEWEKFKEEEGIS